MPRGESSTRKGGKREAAASERADRDQSKAGADKSEGATPVPQAAAPASTAVAVAPAPATIARIENLDPIQLFTLLPIRVYHHIAEVGAGKWFLTVPLAKYAYDGKVVALDDGQAVLDSVAQRASQSRMSNVSTLLIKDGKLPLPDASLDGVVISPVLHESSQPVDLLREISRVLKPDGWVAAIEWIKGASNGGPSAEERIAREDAVKLAQEAGLRVLNQRNLNSYFYYIVLKKQRA
jgi:SAM-dependent methyltransferase